MAAGTDQERSELHSLRQQREELHRELVRKTFRIAELEEQVFETARRYEQSVSWRLTRPVRAVKPLLAKLRR
jgi:SMC interacting uncharacterized protein involved in chromosome segregation